MIRRAVLPAHAARRAVGAPCPIRGHRRAPWSSRPARRARRTPPPPAQEASRTSGMAPGRGEVGSGTSRIVPGSSDEGRGMSGDAPGSSDAGCRMSGGAPGRSDEGRRMSGDTPGSSDEGCRGGKTFPLASAEFCRIISSGPKTGPVKLWNCGSTIIRRAERLRALGTTPGRFPVGGRRPGCVRALRPHCRQPWRFPSLSSGERVGVRAGVAATYVCLPA